MISNMHTHTCFCDGKDTPETMVLQALDQGMEALGFSGHSFAPFDPYCPGMIPENLEGYRREIGRLSALYGDRIRLLTGVELDCDSPRDDLDFDFKIASVHYMESGGRYYAIDSKREFPELLNDIFSGDMHAFVRAYLDKAMRFYAEIRPDIIGHFDLYRNFTPFPLDESEPAYLSAVTEALHELVRQDALIEVNIGALCRIGAKEPYPSVALLKFLQKERARLIITTDCHHAPDLTTGYEETVRLLKELGFPSMVVMGRNGFREEKL